MGVGTACDISACSFGTASSVAVSVTDGAGNLLAADSVSYAVDGEDRGACEALDLEGSEWICGRDETGDFVITVEIGGELFEESATVLDLGDGCIASAFVEVSV